MNKVYILSKVIKDVGFSDGDKVEIFKVFNSLSTLRQFIKDNPLPGWDYYIHQEYKVE